MIRMMLVYIITLTTLVISGCTTGLNGPGWVADPDYYWKLSGFSVQAPSGPNWYRLAKNPVYPNSITFTNIESTPIRFNVYHPEFAITTVIAYGTAVGKKVPRENDDEVGNFLRKALEQYRKEAGLIISDSAFNSSLGASCITYQGKPIKADENSQYGVIRYYSVTGYVCLHPEYNDFLVGMESRNGASVEIKPVNRDHQADHFFKSLRFTPRDFLYVPAGAPSRDEGKRLTG